MHYSTSYSLTQRTTRFVARHRTPAFYERLWRVEHHLQTNPPSIDGLTFARRQALHQFDALVQARWHPAWKEAIGRFYQRAMQRTLYEIAYLPVNQGVRIWKIYNMGFVIKSAKATIGIDIHSGWVFRGALTAVQQKTLASHLDLLCITHKHADHYQSAFAQQMLAQNKPVLVPDQGGFKLQGATHLPDRVGSVVVNGIPVWHYPGRQWHLRNVVYALKVGDCTLVHTGDNERGLVYEQIASQHQVDVLLSACWLDMAYSTRQLQPRLLITGHEHEVRHPGSFCIPFQKSLAMMEALAGQIAVALSWGEGLTTLLYTHPM